MSKFKEWSDKMLIENNNKNKNNNISGMTGIQHKYNNLAADIDFENRLESLLQVVTKSTKHHNLASNEISKETLNFAKISRDLNVNSVLKNINNYDKFKETKNSKYINYNNALSNEMDISEIDNNLDDNLDVILCKKLDLDVAEPEPSQKIVDEINNQERVANMRQLEYIEKRNRIKELVKDSDAVKQANDAKFQTFEEVCLNSDDEDDFVNVNILDKCYVDAADNF